MFDSDFDSTDIGGDDVEFLDTSDSIEEINSDIENSDLDSSNEVDDGLYHATRMSEDEVARIDDMWTQDDMADVEPYHATRNDITLESDVAEPYEAIRNSDSGDLTSDLTETADLEQVQSIESFEEQFASEIEAMSFDDLTAEQERLDRMGGMSDLDIFAEYDRSQSSTYDPELLDALTKDLSSEQRSQLREGLASRDPAVMDYFGLNGNDDANEGFARTRKR